MKQAIIYCSTLSLVTLLFTYVNTISAQVTVEEKRSDVRPMLTVLIGVDQFRASYLMEYNEAFTGGFRRMIDEGKWYQKAIVDHAPTLTLPGHTTLATGSNPRTHGITSNAWIDLKQTPDANGKLHATNPHVDRGVYTVGEEKSVAFSAHRIKVNGLADWFREADPNARTVALSVTGLAPLYGGKLIGENDSSKHVYWLGSSGKFVTSSYYRKDYPKWLERFNSLMPEKYIKHHTWENTVPIEFQKMARIDDAKYEYDKVHTTFPHKAEDMMPEVSDKYYNWWFGRFSPYQNDALFDLAKETIAQLKLGQRSTNDFLSIAVKLTDRIGHDFGPRSLEQLDVILRLDRLLGDFFNYLDDEVGKGNYLIALSADHGAPNVSEYEQSESRKSLRIGSSDIENALAKVEELIDNYSGDEKYLPSLIARELEHFPFISKAMTQEDLLNPNIYQNPYIHAFANSFLEDQPTTYPLWTLDNKYGNQITVKHPANYGVFVDIAYNANIWAASSTHGSSHKYDQEVPILFMGSNVKKGLGTEKAFTRDIAPTIVEIVGLPQPNIVDGKPLNIY